MARTTLIVHHDDTLLTLSFLIEHIAELEGVTDVVDCGTED